MRRFDGKKVLITGAAHGIGRAIAERLVAEGAYVFLVDIDIDAAKSLGRELDSAMAIECDVTDRSSVDRAVGIAEARFGVLDVLVGNVGLGLGPRFVESTDDEWAQQLDLNLVGPVRCVRAALPALLRSRGNVVLIGSINGIGAFSDIAYSTAKAGLINLVKNLTTEFGPKGVRFNVVAPGTIRTRVWDGHEEDLAWLASNLYPLRRVGEPADIAAATAFLASDDAAWISGIVLPVDGGALVGPALKFPSPPEGPAGHGS